MITDISIHHIKSFLLYKPETRHCVISMSGTFHILGFRTKLLEEKRFLKSLLSKKLSTRKLFLEKASTKQLSVLQKLIYLVLSGQIPVTSHFINRLRRSKKLEFIEQRFRTCKKDPDLRHNLIALASVIHLFAKVPLKKK